MPEALTLRYVSMTKLASVLLRPRSLLVLTHGVTRLGSYRPRDCSIHDLTVVNVQTQGLIGTPAQSVRLPTMTRTAGARVRPLLLAAKM